MIANIFHTNRHSFKRPIRNTFKELFYKFYDLAHNILLMFQGRLGEDNPDTTQIKHEIFIKQIPTMSDDRANLKSDAKNIASDLNVSYKEYKETKEKQNV